MPKGRFAVIPMQVTCVSCGKTFTRKHGKFPKFCSVNCRPKTDTASKLKEYSKPVDSGCIEWTKSILKSGGYGQLSVNGTPKRAHVLAYELAFGKIPAGLFVCHRCDNPKCVNVSHLFLGTNKDNMVDAAKKGRVRYGEKHTLATLTASEVRQMRKLWESGETLEKIAETMQKNRSTIYSALSGKTWIRA